MSSIEQDGVSRLGDVEKGQLSTVLVDSAADSRTPQSKDKSDPILKQKSEETNEISQTSDLTLPSKLLHFVTHKSNTDGPIDTNPPPDGGVKAWTVVVMCHLAGFNTWGFLNAFGVLQSYYGSHLGRPPSEISWIGSIQAFSSSLVLSPAV